MIILTVRTDKPEAELGLFEVGAGDSPLKQIAYKTWTAHRQLAENILSSIVEFLREHDMQLGDMQAIVAYKGPGSFTGLRIGLTVVNALADSYGLPIVGQAGESVTTDTSANDKNWIVLGVRRVQAGETDTAVMPFYGAEANITKPRTA